MAIVAKTDVAAIVSEVEERLEGKVQAVQCRVGVLEKEVAELKESPSRNSVLSEWERSTIGMVARATVDQAYNNEDPATVEYPPEGTDWPRREVLSRKSRRVTEYPLMSWDWEATYTAGINSEETRKAKDILQYRLDSVPLSKGVAIANVPPYNENKDAYNSALSAYFVHLKD
ncbi:hypothetical protein QFC24_004614 [Naganishia onofrii]|uniref:Uncharacterized protein n=2 Tax=Naganishia onofrii TaxID=1851511 RepID=A0ACC2XD27_9TREE|nr:hypothetical protein QFC24_004611 [Naganishia onofrii]KAJ9121278.1 hypothetical protein QFC24_004614 [Naganishia onofrii]